MKILITGGNGMVGKNILTHQKFLQHTIIAPTRTELDLLNYNDVETYLKLTKPDILIHAAGIVESGMIQHKTENCFNS